MQVQRSNNLPFRSGLYFSKSSQVLFNKTLNFVNKEGVKISEGGYQYKEHTRIPESIKDMFRRSPFLKTLSKNFDTFVWFDTIPKDGNYDHHLAVAKILWADPTKKYAQTREIVCTSKKSTAAALKKIFEALDK